MDVDSLRQLRARLLKEKPSIFGNWGITPDQVEACWNNLITTLDALIALGEDGTEEDATEVLQQCVERYNDLDEGFITTLEREELCELLYQIGDLCGMDEEEEWVDEWREW